MSQAFQAFRKITPEHIKNFSLQEALTNLGLSRGLSQQQLSLCNWQVAFLKQRIEHLQRQNQHEIDRLRIQNETLKALQKITELQEEIKKLQAQSNQRNQRITRREQAITQREQAITQREQAITKRELGINRREQAINSQESPFYFKTQFLVGYFIGLVGNGISLALGWKKSDEPGYSGFIGGLVIGAILTIGWLCLLVKKLCTEWKAQKAAAKKSIGIIDSTQTIGNDVNDLDDKYSTRYIESY